MKPGVSAVTTAVLPSRATNVTRDSIVASVVRAPRATSTRGISGGGLKKCSPATRPAAAAAEAIAVTDSVLVFVARSAGGGHRRSSSAKIDCFSPSSSGAASMTTSHAARSRKLGGGCQPSQSGLLAGFLEILAQVNRRPLQGLIGGILQDDRQAGP